MQHDSFDHWRLGRIELLTGDDKSTWYHLLSRGWEMAYVPDVEVLTIERPPSQHFLAGASTLMVRWFGNMLRTNGRARKIPRRRVGTFVWWALIDQRISMWTSMFGLDRGRPERRARRAGDPDDVRGLDRVHPAVSDGTPETRATERVHQLPLPALLQSDLRIDGQDLHDPSSPSAEVDSTGHDAFAVARRLAGGAARPIRGVGTRDVDPGIRARRGLGARHLERE